MVGESARFAGSPGGLNRLGQSEVEHLDGAVGPDLDVRRFQIAMNDPRVVRGFEGIDDLPGDSEGVGDGQRTARDQGRQVIAAHQLHDEIGRACRRARVVDVRDVGMIERGQRLGLALEPGEPVGISGKGLRQDLQRHIAIQLRVVGAIDLAHATRAEPLHNLVGIETGASRNRHARHSIDQVCRVWSQRTTCVEFVEAGGP